MQTWNYPRIRRLALAVLIGFLIPLSAYAKTDLDSGWEYRWGDSSFLNSGQPVWTVTDEPGQWQPIAFPSNPPDREARTHVWYRTSLPDGQWKEPVLYIFSVDLIVQVWLDGENIYQFGNFDQAGRGNFEGWPWHAIPLPDGYEEKEIYFRIFSNYTDIGLWGEVAIMEGSELTLYIIENSLEALIVAGFCALIALLAIVFAPLQTREKSFVSIALFAISSSAMLVAESQARLLIWNTPLAWDFLAAGSYFMLPVAMALLLEQWFEDQQTRVINLIWKLHLGYFVAALTLAAVGIVDLSSTFPVFDALLLVSLLTISVLVVRRFRHLGGQQQTMLVAYGFFCSLLIVDMAVAHGFIPWWRVPLSWGAMAFSLSVVMISVVHYASTQRTLRRLNQSLEEQVAERTAKAESLVRKEQARVRLLSFENEKTRVLNNIIEALHDCMGLGQTFHAIARGLPELCSPMKGRFYQRTGDGEAYALVNSWGYADELPFVERLETQDGPPAQSTLVSRYLTHPDQPVTDSDLEAGGTLCFWFNVQSATEGSVPVGLLFVNVRDEFVSGDNSYFGTAKLFQALSQGIQKISITLSGISLREDLQRYSYEDALTGLKNRRYFDQLLEHESAVALRNDKPLSLLMLDIDHFKRFNDSHGHEAGDSALRSFAGLLTQHFRGSDVVCRFGGEEFVVILAGTDLRSAFYKAEGLAATAREHPIFHNGAELESITVSIGVSNWPECSESPDSLLGLADRALYRAKEMGRDRVEVF